MDVFWSDFIEPVLKKIAPKAIVEVGASTGANTKNIVKFCLASHARCEIIDPLEIGNIEEIRADLNACGTHHRDISLNVLPKLEQADVFLIDGDHNWYTVFNELCAILSPARLESKHKLPVIFLHDVEWPYSRRDLYYDPTQIPAEYLLPHGTDGIIPGQSELSSTKGMNFGINQSIREGGEKNGVLTAVEDFISQKNLGDKYQFTIVSGFHGLGCLFPKNTYNLEVETFVYTQLSIPDNLRSYIKKLESLRLGSIMEVTPLRHEIQALCEKLRDSGFLVTSLQQELHQIKESQPTRLVQRAIKKITRARQR